MVDCRCSCYEISMSAVINELFFMQLNYPMWLNIFIPCTNLTLPYILESNLHPFYSSRGLKNQMQIRIACGLDLWSRAGFWKNDRAAVRAVRTIQ